MMRDSLGVPLEPVSPVVVDFDYNSEPIYSDESDIYVEFDGDLVLLEEWLDYTRKNFTILTTNQLIERNKQQ